MNSLFRTLGYLRPHRGLVLTTLSFAMLTTIFDLLPPWLIKVIIDDVIQAERNELLPWVLGGVILAYGLKNFLNSLRIRFNNILEQRVIFQLRQQVFHALQCLSISFYENRSTGEIMSRVMSDTEHVERIFIDGLESMLTATLTLVGITVLLFTLNWKLALCALIPIPILAISAVTFSRRVHGYYHEIRKNTADLSAYLQDALSGIRETMGFNRHDFERARFDQKSQAVNVSTLKAMLLWSVYSPGMIFIGSLGTVFVLWVGPSEVAAGRLSIGELVMFVSYLALFYVPINQIHSVNHLLQHALAASERIFDILDTEPDVIDRPGVQAPRGKLNGTVELNDVRFAYRPDVPVLNGINVTIPSGQRVALVGPSGAGKSTLIKLILRFYDVTDGFVSLGGTDVRDLPLTFVRNQIGLVQQEPFLFNGTVRENLAYSNPEATQSEIEAVAMAARAHDFILELPDKYDTWIGERGVKLSVGQKQRIAIARVLLKDPSVVIFDEATSNIDTETEVQIREALDVLTQGRTTIVIAHRLSTLQQVDRILVLNRGRLEQEGTHADLVNQDGLYRLLYEAQFAM
ncbi:ABC transporter ATP-binding protein [Candidatus Nitronereus thalassa]|uniref:ABC transporter ATP-binding protein n=1 Tax=Candidatus Nitronereus thalassa TaxID=3020898 RepID=A0ABU3K5H7_9BACT|nr:ABC transporter ATP-binding protein [Candidatus Nitronereus thalassa]MDT7041603.1 ABC transporter ATP-binding protein [Candidatus Nitronereus thalassa]